VKREVRSSAWAPQRREATPITASSAAHQRGSPVAVKWVSVKAITVSHASRGAQSRSAGSELRRRPRR
jgi:hypothetical protein